MNSASKKDSLKAVMVGDIKVSLGDDNVKAVLKNVFVPTYQIYFEA